MFWQQSPESYCVFFATLSLASLLFQGSLAAQPPERTAHGMAKADSTRIVRDARSAQSSFESFRRGQLPARARGVSDCDIRIGRYCYWRGDDDDNEAPPEEKTIVRERRAALIRTFDAATTSLPGDSWLAGQFVRYLVEAGRTDEALHFETRCEVTAGWCGMLAGYAAHTAGRFSTADSVFRATLATMDTAERCRWLDISDVLDDELAGRFKKTNCDDRAAFVRRVFRLGSPLFSVSETDVFTEHLARVTRARIAEHAPTPDGDVWADDERELMIRYGWPRWYSRSEPSFGSMTQAAVTGHDVGMPYNFLPKLHAVEHIGSVTADDWTLDEPRATTGYAPGFARSMHELPSQVAAFRRGDSTLVVASWDTRRDTTLIGRDLDAAIVLVGVDSSAGIARGHRVAATGQLSVIGVIDSGMVSVELLASTERRSARAHVGLPARAATGAALSDLLLYAPTDSTATDLTTATATMLAGNTVSGSKSVGAYWEAYGITGQPRPVHYVLSVEQTGIGWLQRARERLHLDDPSTGLRIQWDEVPQLKDGVATRTVRLDLSRLRAGHYHVEVSMTIDSEPAVVSAREVDVR